MANNTNRSPETATSRGRAPASPKKEAAAPKHRRTKAKEPVPVVTSSHHPEVTAQPETPKFTITYEDIATLAFSYWERRGCQGGSPEEDWRRAEEELQSLIR